MVTKTDIKLQAALAHAGIASRRQAEVLIERGLVKVNGRRAVIGQRVIPGKDRIEYKGRKITTAEPLAYVLLNKPLDVVSTTKDELGRRTVLSLLPPSLRKVRLYPVGRLDHDSQGLMLLTNDGELAHRLTHPSFEVPKMYYVKLDRPPTDKAVEHLRRGVKLTDGFTQPAEVELLPERGTAWLSIVIHEGRNRQVRRMMERVGYQVVELTRVTFGILSLKQLGHQQYQQLTPNMVKELRQSLGLSS